MLTNNFATSVVVVVVVVEWEIFPRVIQQLWEDSEKCSRHGRMVVVHQEEDNSSAMGMWTVKFEEYDTDVAPERGLVAVRILVMVENVLEEVEGVESIVDVVMKAKWRSLAHYEGDQGTEGALMVVVVVVFCLVIS
jgi:hypothetical protein